MREVSHIKADEQKVKNLERPSRVAQQLQVVTDA